MKSKEEVFSVFKGLGLNKEQSEALWLHAVQLSRAYGMKTIDAGIAITGVIKEFGEFNPKLKQKP